MPVARITTGAGRHTRAARVSFAEKSERATRDALEPFYTALRRKKPRSFSLVVEGDGLSFADVFAAAARVRGDHSKAPAGPVRLRMVCKLAGGGVARSRPFAGFVVADPVRAEDLPGAVIPIGLLGSFWDGEWYLYDCHAEWRWDGAALRWSTACRGPCAGKGNCTIIFENPPKRVAWGLHFCAC